MNVVYDSHIFLNQKYGGISRYFVELVKHISNIEDISVAVNSPFYINKYLDELDRLQVNGIHIPELKAAHKLFKMFNISLSYLQGKILKPDIWHETYYSSYNLIPKGSKRIITVYDMVHELFPEYFTTNDNTIRVKKSAIEKVDHIICISNKTKEDLLRFYNVKVDKVSVVHLGYYQFENKDSINMSKSLSPFVLYVGMKKGYKNFDRLLNVYLSNDCIHKKFKLVCFGGEPLKNNRFIDTGLMNLYKENVIHLNGGDNILYELYQQAAAFVYPSLYEGFGLPTLEAMANNCPVICSDGGSIPEIVGDAGEFFDPLDEKSILNSLKKVLFNESRTRKLRVIGHERLKQFSWEKCAKDTLDVYRKVIDLN